MVNMKNVKPILTMTLLIWTLIVLSIMIMDVLSYYGAFGFPDDFQMIDRNVNLNFVYPLYIIPLIGCILVIAKYHNQNLEAIKTTTKVVKISAIEELSPTLYQLTVMDLINKQLPNVILFVGRGNRLIANGEMIKGILIEDTRNREDFQADADVFVELIIRQVL